MLLHALTSMLMAEAGHSALHRPQPTQRSSSTTEKLPFQTTMAPRGQTASQAPQAAQCSRSATACFLGFAPFDTVLSIPCHSLQASHKQFNCNPPFYIQILQFNDLLVKLFMHARPFPSALQFHYIVCHTDIVNNINSC